MTQAEPLTKKQARDIEMLREVGWPLRLGQSVILAIEERGEVSVAALIDVLERWATIAPDEPDPSGLMRIASPAVSATAIEKLHEAAAVHFKGGGKG